MKALLLFFLAAVLVGGGLKMAGVRLPLLDYPIGRPAMPAGALWSDTFDGSALDPAKWWRDTLQG